PFLGRLTMRTLMLALLWTTIMPGAVLAGQSPSTGSERENSWEKLFFGIGKHYAAASEPPEYRGGPAWNGISSELGDPQAQFRLGWMYAEGHGVARDDGEALRWFRQAADQGDASAQNWLGWMYQ